MKQLVIIGAGGFGREVLAWARAGAINYAIKGFLDDNPAAASDSRLRAQCLGALESYSPSKNDVFLCAVGTPALRQSITERIKGCGGKFITLVHPTAIVTEGAQLSDGVIICPNALVSVDARIGEGAVVYYHSSVDHDAIIGPWTQISGHCDVTGGASLGQGVFLGSHATVLPRIRVGDYAIVGAGAVVTCDVEARATVVGVPARPHLGSV